MNPDDIEYLDMQSSMKSGGHLRVVVGPWGGPSISLRWPCLEKDPKCFSGKFPAHYVHNHSRDVTMNISYDDAIKLRDALTELIDDD